VKATLDSIAVDDNRKREVIRGDAVDKAEQLSKFMPENGYFGDKRPTNIPPKVLAILMNMYNII